MCSIFNYWYFDLQFPKPNVSPVADLKDPKTLRGLRYRVVAIESL